ncbi:MAG: T9SS type A sorting domain-containing protein [candidate division Zixibacteria bacterium]|nr:T9SS type A sorting domain-containing protein [candidate division Zixibacteria bacterium]
MKCTIRNILDVLLISIVVLILASPGSKAQDTARFIQNFYSHTVTVETDDTLGGAVLKFLGEITPELLQTQMIMDYSTIGDTTRVLIYSMSSEFFLAGSLLSFTGNGILIYTEASTADSVSLPVPTKIEVITGIDDGEPDNIPGDYVLHQNYPNPFNAGTRLEFELKRGTSVKLDIFDITGKPVGSLYDGYLRAGEYSFTWNASDFSGKALPSGVYLYRLQADDVTLNRKMVLLK